MAQGEKGPRRVAHPGSGSAVGGHQAHHLACVGDGRNLCPSLHPGLPVPPRVCVWLGMVWAIGRAQASGGWQLAVVVAGGRWDEGRHSGSGLTGVGALSPCRYHLMMGWEQPAFC